ncbi:amino acid ABC transporter substrate-binding protein [Amaricoccus sp.]|uniref:amino acid ABC transporter substrate-binding protein n=1 Tax=Amaricoccus sp. TaxID=1872485 RepID=UPI002B70CF14|nr:amino acid ABC transporter substrate-binding protein [Amaricoccus sp.]HRW16177.1 amino acid ABC transporter substrate-binding protein [Amaricoccus sp.]
MRPTARHLLAAAFACLATLPAAAQTLDRIRDTGELRIGYREDAAPLSYAGEAGLPSGYSVLICDAIAEHLAMQLGTRVKPTHVLVGAEDRFDAVVEGRIDLLCGAASITLDRREIVDFSLPVFVDGAAVMLPADAPHEFEALAGKKIGVRAGTTTEIILRNSLAAKAMEAEVVPLENHTEGLAALEEGRIDAYFGDQSILFALYFASDMAESFVVSDNTLTVEKQGLALTRGDSDFRLAVDRAISDLFLSGRMADFFRESFPGAQPGLALEALFLLGPDLP